MSNKIQVDIDTKTFVRFWLVILGLGLAALFIWKALAGILIVGISLFLAIAISPLVNKLADVTPGEGRKAPTAVAYIIVMAALTMALAVIVPAVVGETTKFVKNLPDMVEEVSGNMGWINDFGGSLGIDNLQGEIVDGMSDFSAQFVKDFGTNILNSVGAVGSFLAAFVLILVLTFLMMMGGPEMMQGLWQRHSGNRKVMRLQRVLDRMADVVAKYVSGALMVSLVDGLATTLVVFILAMVFGFSPELAVPFGLITGVMSLIPMFGAFIGGVLVAVLIAVNSVWAGVMFIVYFVVYLQVEANVISPKVQSRGMRLPALLVLVSVTIGVYMFGLIGAIVAIPIAGCIRVLIDEFGDGEKAER